MKYQAMKYTGRKSESMAKRIAAIASVSLILVLINSKASGEVDIPTPKTVHNPTSQATQSPSSDTSVSNDGSLSYSYPILLPPGRGGVDPKISISYSSHRRTNGYLGVGFHLGFSTIQRATKHGLDYDNDEDFVADGKEIVPRPEWGYERYGAKIESAFTKYRYHRSDGIWTADRRDGIRVTYKPKQKGPGGQIFKWFVTSIEDPLGNETTYDYTNVSNQIYPKLVKYGGNSRLGIQPIYKVTFKYGDLYESQNDVPESWSTHRLTKTTRRLEAIKIYVNNDLARMYHLEYDVSVDNMSTLVAIDAEEYTNGESSDRSTTKFAWHFDEVSRTLFSGDVSDSSTGVSNVRVPEFETGYKVIHFDYNGDKQQDMLHFYNSSFIDTDSDWSYRDYEPHISIFRSTDKKVFEEKDFGNSALDLLFDNDNDDKIMEVVALDYNGDNLDDLLFWGGEFGDSDKDVWYLFQSLGDPSGKPEFELVSSGNNQGDFLDLRFVFNRTSFLEGKYDGSVASKLVNRTSIMPMDFNGDGKQDLLVYNGYNAFTGGTDFHPDRSIRVLKSDGRGSFTSVASGSLMDEITYLSAAQSQGDEIQILDFNGDGYDDFVTLSLLKGGDTGGSMDGYGIDGYLCYHKSNGSGFAQPQCGHINFLGSYADNITLDWDGLVQPESTTTGFTWERHRENMMTVLDYNGDGNSDLLISGPGRHRNSRTREFMLFRSDGTGEFPPFSVFGDGYFLTQDYEGEGRELADFVEMYQDDGIHGLGHEKIMDVAPIDFNMDGMTDLFFNGSDSSVVAISKGNGRFEKLSKFKAPSIANYYFYGDSKVYPSGCAEHFNRSVHPMDVKGSGTMMLYERADSLVYDTDLHPNEIRVCDENRLYYAGYKSIPHLLRSITTVHTHVSASNSNLDQIECVFTPDGDDGESYHKKISIEYDTSTNIAANLNLQTVMPLVHKVTVDHGSNVHRDDSETAYYYGGGYYSKRYREFRGFENVTKYLPGGTVVKEEYETQNHFTKGKLVRSTVRSGTVPKSCGIPCVTTDKSTKTVEYSWAATPFDDNPRAAFVRLEAREEGTPRQINEEGDSPVASAYAVRTEVVDVDRLDREHRYVTHVNYEYDMGNMNGLVTMEKNELVEGGPNSYTISTRVYINVGTNRQNWKVGIEEIKGTSSVGNLDSDDGYIGSATRRKLYYYHMDGTGRLERELDAIAEGTTNYPGTSYEYDGWYNVRTVYDPMWRATHFEYDDVLHTYPTRIVQSSSCSSAGCGSSPAPHVTENQDIDYKYGKARKTIDQNGNVTTTVLDALGRVEEVHQPNFPAGAKMVTKFLDRRFPRTVISSVPVKWDTQGLETIETWTYVDGSGNTLQTVTNAEKQDGRQYYTSTLHKYDQRGRNYKTYGPYLTSSKGWQLNSSQGSSGVCGDTNVNYTQRWRWSIYDYLGREKQVKTSNEDSTISALTDYLGLTTRVTDPDGNKSDTKADHLGRILEVVERNFKNNVDSPGINFTHYTYNSAGDLLSIRSSIDRESGKFTRIEYEYDLQGQKTYMSDPDMGAWNYYYHKDGSLDYVWDANYNVIQYEYDNWGRVLSKTTEDKYGGKSDKLEFKYDTCHDPGREENTVSTWKENNCIGQLFESKSFSYEPYGMIHWIEETSTRVNAYNELGQVLSESKWIEGAFDEDGVSQEFTTDTIYDLAGKPTMVEYPNGLEVETTYHRGTTLIHHVRELGSDTSYAMLEGYDATGKIGDQYHGFADHDSYATKTEYLYGDNSGRLKHLRTLRGPQAGCGGPSSCENPYLQEKDYFYEQSGDIQKIIHHRLGRTYSYQYDGLHRLVGESRVDDGAVPRSTQANLVNTYNGTTAHGVSETVDLSTGRTTLYARDSNGNLINQYKFGGIGTINTLQIEYNAENMPKHIYNSRYYPHSGSGSTVLTSFAYDANGKRVAKRIYNGDELSTDDVPYETTYYISDAFEVREWDEPAFNFRNTYNYIFAGNQRVAQVVGEVIDYYEADRHVHYLHKDHLGSTTVMTFEDGTPQYTHTSYRPFGTPRYGSRTNSYTTYHFTDQEWDWTTDLYNYDARLYDPENGLFVTPDSLLPNIYDPQQLNRYAYCRNNPLIYTDPSGHTSMKDAYYAYQNAILAGNDPREALFGFHDRGEGEGDITIGEEKNQGTMTPNDVGGMDRTYRVVRKIPRVGQQTLTGEQAAHPWGILSKIAGELFRIDEYDAAVLSSGGIAAVADGPLFFGDIYLMGTVVFTGGRRVVKAAQLARKMLKACFPEGTLVWTADGLVAIEDIDPGDIVLCANMDSGEWVYCEVEDTLAHDYNGLMVSLKIDGETIEATGNHPFWVGAGVDLHQRPIAEDTGEVGESDYGYGRWVAAKDIHVGDWITILGGAVAQIDSVEYKHVELPVFNLQVDQFSTYAVGEDAVLVHNKDSFRRVARNLLEKLTLDQAKTGAGKRIMTKLGDPRFKGMEKWEHKVRHANGTKTTVHYVRDPKTGTLMDFKFK